MDQEDTEDVENLCSVMRLQIVSPVKLDISSVTKDHVKRTEESDQLPIPEHFLNLCEKSSMGLEADDKQKLINLLIKYQDSLSRSEWD